MIGSRSLDQGNALHRLLSLLASVVLSIGLVQAAAAEEKKMTDIRPTLHYTLTVHAENMQARLYVNGAPLLLHAETRPMLVTVPITEMLTPGENRITLDYEPLNVEARSYTPHPGVMVQVVLERRSNPLEQTAPPILESVHLFSGRYDALTDQMAAQPESVFGQGALQLVDGGLAAGPAALAPVVMQFNNRSSDGHAMRLEMPFQVDDTPMPTPPWIDSPALTDTVALRQELVARYRQLHDIIARGSERDFRHAMRFIYAHDALVLGYRDAEALADDIRSKMPLGPEPGTTLAPLPADLADARLEFGSDSRMARFMPSPLHFETPDGSSAGAYRLFFCRIGGALEPCFMQSIPY